MPHRNCILMNADDVELAGFREHERVSVRGDAGQLDDVEIICGDVRQGTALKFYPEANVLMKARIEKRSGTPALNEALSWYFVLDVGRKNNARLLDRKWHSNVSEVVQEKSTRIYFDL